MKARKGVWIGAILLVACGLSLMGCKGNVKPKCPEHLFVSFITPKNLIAKEVACSADSMTIVVAVAEKQRHSDDNSPSEYLRICKYKGDTAYFQELFYGLFPGSLATDVKAIRISECQTDGTGSIIERDLAMNAQIIHESLDDHVYKGYLNSGPHSNRYCMMIRVHRVEQPLNEFAGIRLPHFPNYWIYKEHPLCTLRLSPPPTAQPGFVRIEVLLDETPYTLDVEIGESFQEPWVERPR